MLPEPRLARQIIDVLGQSGMPLSKGGTYDPERDVYHCPQSHPLTRHTAKHTEQVTVYRAKPAIFNACPVKAACTSSNRGRTVHRSLHVEYLDRVRT
jgi:hypothetical protein